MSLSLYSFETQNFCFVGTPDTKHEQHFRRN